MQPEQECAARVDAARANVVRVISSKTRPNTMNRLVRIGPGRITPNIRTVPTRQAIQAAQQKSCSRCRARSKSQIRGRRSARACLSNSAGATPCLLEAVRCGSKTRWRRDILSTIRGSCIAGDRRQRSYISDHDRRQALSRSYRTSARMDVIARGDCHHCCLCRRSAVAAAAAPPIKNRQEWYRRGRCHELCAGIRFHQQV